MTTDIILPPMLKGRGSTAFTVPEMLAWMGAETNPPGSPILCPIFTLSPTATIGLQGAPMCIDMGMTTSAGAASCSMAFSLVAAFMSLG